MRGENDMTKLEYETFGNEQFLSICSIVRGVPTYLIRHRLCPRL